MSLYVESGYVESGYVEGVLLPSGISKMRIRFFVSENGRTTEDVQGMIGENELGIMLDGNKSKISLISQIGSLDFLGGEDLSGVFGELNNLNAKADANSEEIATAVENITNRMNSIVDSSDFAERVNELLPDLTPYAKKDELPDLTPYAKKDELPDLTPYAKKDELPDLTPYAKKDELPDLTPYAKKDELPDLAEYAKKSELADLVLSDNDVKTQVISQVEQRVNDYIVQNTPQNVANLATEILLQHYPPTTVDILANDGQNGVVKTFEVSPPQPDLDFQEVQIEVPPELIGTSYVLRIYKKRQR